MENKQNYGFLLEKIETGNKMTTIMEFKPGLNIITAPYGAGKTMLWSFLKWTLGGRIFGSQKLKDFDPISRITLDKISVKRNKAGVSYKFPENDSFIPCSIKKMQQILLQELSADEEYFSMSDILEFYFERETTDFTIEKIFQTKIGAYFYKKIFTNGYLNELYISKKSLENEFLGTLEKLFQKSIVLAKESDQKLKEVIATYIYELFKEPISIENNLITINRSLKDSIRSALKTKKDIEKKVYKKEQYWHRNSDFNQLKEMILNHYKDIINFYEIKEFESHYLTNESQGVSSKGMKSIIYFLTKAYIISQLPFTFPWILDDAPLGTVSLEQSKFIYHVFSKLPQCIVFTSKGMLPNLSKKIERHERNYNRIFHDISLEVFDKFNNLIKEQNWQLIEDYVEIGNLVYRPDFILKTDEAQYIIEFKTEITTNSRIQLSEILEKNKNLRGGFIISNDEIVFARSSKKIRSYTLKVFCEKKLHDLIEEIKAKEEEI